MLWPIAHGGGSSKMEALTPRTPRTRHLGMLRTIRVNVQCGGRCSSNSATTQGWAGCKDASALQPSVPWEHTCTVPVQGPAKMSSVRHQSTTACRISAAAARPRPACSSISITPRRIQSCYRGRNPQEMHLVARRAGGAAAKLEGGGSWRLHDPWFVWAESRKPTPAT